MKSAPVTEHFPHAPYLPQAVRNRIAGLSVADYGRFLLEIRIKQLYTYI